MDRWRPGLCPNSCDSGDRTAKLLQENKLGRVGIQTVRFAGDFGRHGLSQPVRPILECQHDLKLVLQLLVFGLAERLQFVGGITLACHCRVGSASDQSELELRRG